MALPYMTCRINGQDELRVCYEYEDVCEPYHLDLTPSELIKTLANRASRKVKWLRTEPNFWDNGLDRMRPTDPRYNILLGMAHRTMQRNFARLGYDGIKQLHAAYPMPALAADATYGREH